MSFVTGSGGSGGAASSSVDISNVNNAWGIAVGDIIVLLADSIKTGGGQGNIACADFTLVASETTATIGRTCILLKRAVSADVNPSGTVTYTISSSTAEYIWATMAAWRGRLASGDPVDVVSDTAYITNNAVVRAVSMTIGTAGSDVIWGGFSVSDPVTLAAPGGMASRVSYDNAPDGLSLELADLLNQSAGATGDKDGTAGSAATIKHAFMMALKPALASGNPWNYYA